jgi:hypothetical protein
MLLLTETKDCRLSWEKSATSFFRGLNYGTLGGDREGSSCRCLARSQQCVLERVYDDWRWPMDGLALGIAGDRVRSMRGGDGGDIWDPLYVAE